MVRYNIYGHVLYSEIKYEELMNTTERIFINALMNDISSIEQWTNDIWNDIDHEYMIRTLQEIKKDVISSDYATFMQYKDTKIDFDKMIDMTDKLANLYEINSIDKFKAYEKSFGRRVSNEYKIKYEEIKSEDPYAYLTQLIKDYDYINQYIPYKRKNYKMGNT